MWMHVSNKLCHTVRNFEFSYRLLHFRIYYPRSSSSVYSRAFLLFNAVNPCLISCINGKSERIAIVSFQLSNSSGLTKTAAGEPFFVITTSSSVVLILIRHQTLKYSPMESCQRLNDFF